MSDLQELYQSVILDHNRKPRNFGELPDANRSADGKNPLCGDEVHVALVVEDDVIREVKFTGHGCAISKASASLMTAAVKGNRPQKPSPCFSVFMRWYSARTARRRRTGKHWGSSLSFPVFRVSPFA